MAKRGEIVITTNSTGTECYVVSRQDSEGRILETLWEAPARSEQLSEAYADNVLDPLWKMGGNDGEAYKIALAYARKAFPDCWIEGPGDEPSAEHWRQAIGEWCDRNLDAPNGAMMEISERANELARMAAETFAKKAST